ncbi:hypothetical protein [Phenylobacterium sp.]|uniref:hypothetical protein n=1 Tax=Phenylobacterium sp. TaxID=1871053 RepID=UPI002F3F904F
MRLTFSLAALFGAALAAAPPPAADAQPAGRPLRVVAEAVSSIGGLHPRFVIDAVVTPGDSAFHSDVRGWFAALPPGAGSDTIEGACVEAQCALSGSLAVGKMALSADLAGDGPPAAGRLILSDDDGRKIGESAMRLTPVTGPIPGLGELAAPDAVGAVELADILMWNGSPPGFSNGDDGPVSWLQRQALAEWQASHAHPANGLVLTADLVELRRQADKAKAAAGWAAMGDPARGWTAGYPAALLPRAVPAGLGEKRFTSADGQAVLAVSVGPPLSGPAFDAFVEGQVADRPGVENRSYTRVNGDMEITYEEKGQVVSAAYHNRTGGFARVEFTHPVARKQAFAAFDTILPRSLRVTDTLSPG